MKHTYLFLVLTIVVVKLTDPCVSASTKVITDHSCHPSGFVQTKASTNTIHCSSKNIFNCCKTHKIYPKFHCSPPVTSHTEAIMTITSFVTPNQAMRPISYNSNTKNNGGEMSANGVRYNDVTSIIVDKTDGKGDMSVDGSRGNLVASIDSRSNNNASGEEISIDGVRQNTIASVDSTGGNFVDGNSYNVVSSFDYGSSNEITCQKIQLEGVRHNTITGVDSESNSASSCDESSGGNVYVDGDRKNATSRIDSGSNSVDGSRYNVLTSIDHFKSLNESRTSKCRNNNHHNDNEMIVKLSTGWYDGGRRCQKMVRINWKGKSVIAKVVGECDSVNGCDSTTGYRVPCKSNVVLASPAVWKALRVPKIKYGKLKITWSDL